jgi:hypothetical protein
MTRPAARSAPLLLFAGLLLSSCGWGTMSEQEFANEYGSLSLAPFVGQSLFDHQNALAFVRFVEGRLGEGVRVRSLTIHAAHATFEAVTAARPGQMDLYFYSHGAFTHTSPVRLSGREDLDRDLFDLADAGIEHVPEMIQRACAETQPGRGAMPGAVWNRKGSQLRVVVRCDSPRRSGGYVVFDAAGRVLEIRR